MMWSPFISGGKYYYFNVTFDSNVLSVRLTDLVKEWREVVSSDDISLRFMKDNHVEEKIENDRVFNLLRGSLKPDCEDVKSALRLDGTDCHLTISRPSDNLSCYFNMIEVSAELFKNDITVPLLTIIKELTRRQERLKVLLKEKDKEINEYKLEGVKLYRTYLETAEYDDREFVENCEKTMATEFRSTVENVTLAFSREVDSMYESAIKVAQSHTGLKRSSPLPVNVNQPVAGPSEQTRPIWHQEAQPAKRFKAVRTKIRL